MIFLLNQIKIINFYSGQFNRGIKCERIDTLIQNKRTFSYLIISYMLFIGRKSGKNFSNFIDLFYS